METKLFRKLEIGQRFRIARFNRRELIKIEPIRRENGSVLYNAQYIDGRNTNIGHGAKCQLPPYELDPNRPSAWQQLTPRVKAAGWKSLSELHNAMIAGLVEIPRKPE